MLDRLHCWRTLLAAALQPVITLLSADAQTRALSLLVAIASVLWGDAFLALLGLLGAASVVDTWLGRWKARHVTRDYDAERAARGKVAKLAGVAFVLLLRGLELWLARNHGADTGGMIGTAAAFALFLTELKSIERLRVGIGASPIPLLSAAFTYLDALQGRFLPTPPAAPAQPALEGAG
jgi:hypothetical protein